MTGRYTQSVFLQTGGGRERREGGHDCDWQGRQRKPACRRRGRGLRSGTVVHIRAAFEGRLRRVHLSEHPHRLRAPALRHHRLQSGSTSPNAHNVGPQSHGRGSRRRYMCSRQPAVPLLTEIRVDVRWGQRRRCNRPRGPHRRLQQRLGATRLKNGNDGERNDRMRGTLPRRTSPALPL